MRCHDVRELLGAHLDSELDATTTLEVNRHLERCAACRARFHAEERIEAAARAELQREAGDEQQIFERVAAAALSSASRPRRVWSHLAIAATALLAAAIALALALASTDPPHFVRAAAADHEKYRSGRLAPHVATSSVDAVRSYLEPELGIALGALPGAVPGADGRDAWQIRGPRLCRLKDALVGLVMLERRGVPVSLFVAPDHAIATFGEPMPASAARFALARGHAAVVERDGVVRCAVGEIPVEELLDLVDLVDPVETRGR